MIRSFAAALLAAVAFSAGGSVSFDYKMNGDDWAKLEDSSKYHPYELCDTGKEQSPIDLT